MVVVLPVTRPKPWYCQYVEEIWDIISMIVHWSVIVAKRYKTKISKSYFSRLCIRFQTALRTLPIPLVFLRETRSLEMNSTAGWKLSCVPDRYNQIDGWIFSINMKLAYPSIIRSRANEIRKIRWNEENGLKNGVMARLRREFTLWKFRKATIMCPYPHPPYLRLIKEHQ